MPGRMLTEVTPGVYVATAGLWTTTSTVVVANDGTALVVDPAMSVPEVEDLADEIHARGWHVTAGFSTHPHWDHLLWSHSFGEVPRWITSDGARAASKGADRSRRECAELAPGHDLAYLTAVVPLSPDADTLPWPGRRTVLVRNAAHAPGHAALIVGDALLAGDMLSDVEVPLLNDESDDPLGDYRAGLDTLADATRTYGIRVVVPGHGTPAVGPRQIRMRFVEDRGYLHALAARAAASPGPADAAIDRRIVGHVCAWHADQLADLRMRSRRRR